MSTQPDITPRKLLVPGVVMAMFWVLAVVLWQSSGYWQPLLLFGYIGAALGLGLGLYGVLPKQRKPMGRRVALLLVGSFLIGFVALLGRENIQMEGFWFGLLTGFIQAGVVHYVIAKLAGPLLFGRLWCGWACWTVMVLDLLPFQRSPGRLPGHWGWLRYVHFGASMGLVALLYYGFGYGDGVAGRPGIAWFIGGNLLYYGVGIGLALALRDNRAFCKYVCPVSVPLKVTGRFSILKVGTTAENCSGCRACDAMCPMDIRVADYALAGKRVLSTECSLCQTCITVCSREALRLSAGFDVGGDERLRVRGGRTE